MALSLNAIISDFIMRGSGTGSSGAGVSESSSIGGAGLTPLRTVLPLVAANAIPATHSTINALPPANTAVSMDMSQLGPV